MKDSEFYTCEYCYDEFKPRRRRVQKYCSNSCRSKAYQERQNGNRENKSTTVKHNIPILENNKNKKQMVEKISLAGVGNAAIGTLTADGIKALATPNHLKAATRGDIQNLVEKLNARYLFIRNIPPNHFGNYPYYDLIEEKVVYLIKNQPLIK